MFSHKHAQVKLLRPGLVTRKSLSWAPKKASPYQASKRLS